MRDAAQLAPRVGLRRGCQAFALNRGSCTAIVPGVA